VSEAGGPSQGRMGEAAACLSADQKERSGNDERDGGRRLLIALGRAEDGKRGR
jgi:hypothetical protein